MRENNEFDIKMELIKINGNYEHICLGASLDTDAHSTQIVEFIYDLD